MKKEIELNNKIRELRKANGFSQEFMADSLKISQRAYSKIECCETQLTFERITQIARILGLTSWQMIALETDVILGNKPLDDDVANFVPIDLVKRLFDEYDAKIKILNEELETANEMINQLQADNSND